MSKEDNALNLIHYNQLQKNAENVWGLKKYYVLFILKDIFVNKNLHDVKDVLKHTV